MSVMSSQITGVSKVCSPVCYKRKHQSAASLAFVRGIHRWPVDFPSQRTSKAEMLTSSWHVYYLDMDPSSVYIHIILFYGIFHKPRDMAILSEIILTTYLTTLLKDVTGLRGTLPVTLLQNCASCGGNTLQWRHIKRDGISNHQPHGCLLRRLFRHKSKKTSKLRVTDLCVGNS